MPMYAIMVSRLIAALVLILLANDVQAKVKISGGSCGLSPPNYAQVHAPAGVFTTNTGGVQGGYGLVITPIRSGVVYVHATGDLANSNDLFGASIQLDYGTGTPPAQGVIAPAGNGQMIGNHLTVYLAGEPTSEATGTVIYVLSGLTLGTTYWVDLVIAAVDGGTGRFYNMSIIAI